jgi:hypothetical protein
VCRVRIIMKNSAIMKTAVTMLAICAARLVCHE